MTASEQARADAMADAETLRPWLLSRGWGDTSSARSLYLGAGFPPLDDPRHAGRVARARARAAFRAVPGLRGGR